MSGIPDFSDSEMWVVQTTLKERYSALPDTHLADTEMRLEAGKSQPASCPRTECVVTLLQAQADHQARAHASGPNQAAANRLHQATRRF